MDLANPHIRVEGALVQAVAVCPLLRCEHYIAQLVRQHEAVAPSLAYLLFKEEAGVYVAYYQCRVLEPVLYEHQLLIVALRVVYGVAHQQGLVEVGGCLRHRHGVIPVQRAVVLYLHLVEAVAQLVREGNDVPEQAAEVGQYPELARAEGRHAICAAHLALAGIYVYPVLGKGAACRIRKLPVEG